MVWKNCTRIREEFSTAGKFVEKSLISVLNQIPVLLRKVYFDITRIMKVNFDVQLSKNFRLSEFMATNSPMYQDECITFEVVEKLTTLCRVVLQPLRDEFGVISISSGYRSKQLNTVVGGASKSLHMRGRAADIPCKNLIEQNKYYLFLQKLPHTELIKENKKGVLWIHIAL